jgi:hypothetical protein
MVMEQDFGSVYGVWKILGLQILSFTFFVEMLRFGLSADDQTEMQK